MKASFIPIIAAVLIAGGCAGSRPPAAPMLREAQGYARDLDAMNPGAPALDLLRSGRVKMEAAEPLVVKGDDAEAVPILRRSLADLQTALAVAEMLKVEGRADDRRREAEAARQRWQEMIILLEQTERVSRRQAEHVDREIPRMEEPLPGNLPLSTLSSADVPGGTPDELIAAWEAWASVASGIRAPTADLEARFRPAIEAATAKKASDAQRAANAYVAGRALQSLEARVRRSAGLEVCARSTALTTLLGNARDEGLRASLELERGLKDDLRAELEQAREEARERQSSLYQALQQIEGQYAHITQTARGAIVSLADILFDFDKATLKRNVEFSLVKVATILNQFPEMEIAVEGHTDNIGTAEYNLDLSRRRAQAVHDFLLDQDVAADRMTVEGYGLTRPVADNDTEEGRQRNRRVDLVIQGTP